MRRRATIARITVLVGLVVAAVRLLAPASLHLFDLKTLDVRYRLRGAIPPSPEIVIVAIDEPSLATVGRWPWSRLRLAALVEAIANAKPAAIGMDIVFDQRDDSFDATALEAAVAEAPDRPSSELLAAMRGIGDTRLAAALKGAGMVSLAYFGAFDGATSPTLARDVVGLPTLTVRTVGGAEVEATDALLAPHRIHRALPALATAAGGGGHINMLPDADGYYRRVPMAIRVGDRVLPAMSLQLVRRHLGNPAATLTLSPHEVTGIRLGQEPLPVDTAGNAWLNVLGPPGRFAQYAAADVLAGHVPTAALHGRIVLVGFTAGGFDDVSTPFDPVTPGVELQATIVDNLLRHRTLWHPWWCVPAEAAVVLGAALVIGGSASWFGGLGGSFTVLGIIAAYALGSQWLFATEGIVLGAMYPIGGFVLCWLAGAVFQATTEAREKQRIRTAFRHYLSPEVTEMLAADPSRLRLGGERTEITVLFSDLEGFTTLSERLEPEVLGAFLNEYLTAMTDIVLRHGGLLDKYVGDAIMAFWGAPIPIPDHAERCCAAALEMRATLERLNDDWRTRGLPVLRVRVGITTGSAAVGNFGSHRRFSYTALGDTVNLASRLEGLNKTHGTTILIAEGTRQALGDRFVCREVGSVEARGRRAPVTAYELVPHAASPRTPPTS